MWFLCKLVSWGAALRLKGVCNSLLPEECCWLGMMRGEGPGLTPERAYLPNIGDAILGPTFLHYLNITYI